MTKNASGEQTAIGPWLLTPLLIIAALGHGLLNNPHYVTRIMSNNAYWAFPIAVIYLVPAFTAFYQLAKRFPRQNLIEQGKSILGPFLGTVTGLLYLGFLFLFLAITTRDIVNLASMYYLFITPVKVLAFLYLLTAVWLASKGIETLTRTASIMVIPALLIIVILMIMGFSNISIINLKPIFTPNLVDYLKAGAIALNNFYFLGLAAMILPYLKPIHSFPRFTAGTLFLLLCIFGVVAVGCIGVMGPHFLLRFAYPSLAYFRAVKLPNLEQPGMIIGIAWLVIILVGSSFGHYTLALGMSQLAPFFDYKKWVWVLFPAKFLVIIWPAGVLQSKMLVDFVAAIGWIPLFAYPLVLWLIALIFGKKGAKTHET